MKSNLPGVSIVFSLLIAAASCSREAPPDTPQTPINAYDGLYTYRGNYTLLSNGFTINATVINGIELHTTGPYTNVMFLRPAGVYAWPTTFSTGAVGFYNNITPVYEFEPGTNRIKAVTNYYSPQVPAAVVFAIDTTYNNRYDPATRTIYARYRYGNFSSTRMLTDTLIYTGPR